MGELEPKDVLETGFKALFGPVQDLFLKLTGPAAEEYGLMWSDSVRMRRTKRLVSGLAKTKKMLEDAGVQADIVPDKLLLPIFEGMSMEDDENLSKMWASLLANAASPENAQKVRPGFIATLKQMAPDEAALLMIIPEVTTDFLRSINAGSRDEAHRKAAQRNALLMAEIRRKFPNCDGEEESATDERLATCVQVLQTLGLVEYGGNIVTITAMGRTFLEVVRPPAHKK